MNFYELVVSYVADITLIYHLQPYGRIVDVTYPSPVPAGTLRSAVINFRHVRSAAIARNTIHGLAVPSDTSGAVTRLRTSYQQPIQVHAVRDYISNHPKIFLPVLFFIIGSLTYTVRLKASLLCSAYNDDTLDLCSYSCFYG